MMSGVFSRARLAIAVLLAALAGLPTSARAGGTGGEYSPIVEAGVNFFSGTTGTSPTGALSFGLDLRAEARKGLLRPHTGLDLTFSSGTTSISGTTTAFTLYGGMFQGGLHIFVFKAARFMPFLGGSGNLGWHFLKLPSAIGSTEPNTQGLSYGFDVSAGVDLRFGNVEGTALRVHTAYQFINTTLAGIAPYGLNTFRFSLGLVF